MLPTNLMYPPSTGSSLRLPSQTIPLDIFAEEGQPIPELIVFIDFKIASMRVHASGLGYFLDLREFSRLTPWPSCS